MNEDSETGYLLEEAWKLYGSEMHHTLADEALESGEYEVDDVRRMVEIALICTQSPPSSRPTMSEILVMIRSDRSAGQVAPQRPSLGHVNRGFGENVTVSNGSSASNASVSITQFTGR